MPTATSRCRSRLARPVTSIAMVSGLSPLTGLQQVISVAAAAPEVRLGRARSAEGPQWTAEVAESDWSTSSLKPCPQSTCAAAPRTILTAA
jgi:hypothetical protein